MIIRWLEGIGKYNATYNVIAHADVPMLLLGRLPIVGTVASIYAFLLRLTGYSTTHEISWWKGLIAELIGDFVVIGLVIVIFFWYYRDTKSKLRHQIF